MTDLSGIVKAYDVRGVVGEELDDAVVRDIGAALARLLRAEDETTRAVVVGYDMRDSSPTLAAAFAEGVTGQGLDVVSIGLASTDMLYYASGMLGLPGAMFTASHNPARYNGIKLCRAGASPIGQDTGLASIRAAVEQGVPAGPGGGRVTERNLLADYAGYLRGLVDLTGIRPLKIVVDAGNGMGGYTVPAVLADSLDVVPLYFELDGSFPNHEANPLDPANLVDLQKRVVVEGADLGLAFDGDADRCFVVDERGEPVSPSAITALVAARELAKAPGSAVIHNLITSRAVPEIIGEHGGRPVRTRVGHSFIKQTMAETDAVFGGEHSAHYYFRDFWRADTGMLAALHLLAALGDAGGVAFGRSWRATTATRPPARSTRRWPTRPRRPPPCAPRSPTAPSSTSSTGSPSPCVTDRGSTSARPTPSRCCGSTSRPPTPPPWPRSATRCWRSFGREGRPEGQRRVP